MWDGDSRGDSALDGASTEALRPEMAASRPLQTFSYKAYTCAGSSGRLRVRVRQVHGPVGRIPVDGCLGARRAVLLPLPSFSGAATANTDLPDSSHLVGAENSHTGGTIGVFCTYSHPQCLGEMFLNGSERQRMPREFVAQRYIKMPLGIISDFACATLKSVLVRLPLMAGRVPLECDRFHRRENSTHCLAALSRNSYESTDAIRTSSCEERNSLSRRQQHRLRQMKKDQFVTLAVFQHAVSKAVAMHRDRNALGPVHKWQELYRMSHVDLVGTNGYSTKQK